MRDSRAKRVREEGEEKAMTSQAENHDAFRDGSNEWERRV